MPRKKKKTATKSTAKAAIRKTTTVAELEEALEVFGRAEKLYPTLVARRDALQVELQRLDGALAKLRVVAGESRAAPTPAAKAPAAPKAKKAGGRRKRRARVGGEPTIVDLILGALGSSALSSVEVFDAVAAKRPGIRKEHIHTSLNRLRREGKIKATGGRGSYKFAAA